MGFEVRVNGNPVHVEQGQVVSVSVQSPRGELYRAGISTEGVIDVILEVVPSGGPRRLDQIEAQQRREDQARVQDQVAGNAPTGPGHDMLQTQAIQNDTLREGGPSEDIANTGTTTPPSVDLAQGLHPADSETLTARIDAFAEHGDAQKAISDNPAQVTQTTAEQGVTENPAPAPAPSPEPVGPKPGEFPIAQENVNAPVSSAIPPPETTPEGNQEALAATAAGTRPAGADAAPAGSTSGAAPASQEPVSQEPTTQESTFDIGIGNTPDSAPAPSAAPDPGKGNPKP